MEAGGRCSAPAFVFRVLLDPGLLRQPGAVGRLEWGVFRPLARTTISAPCATASLRSGRNRHDLYR